MNNSTSDIYNILDSISDSDLLENVTGTEDTASNNIQVIQLDDGEIDPRLKLISHSSRTTLHKCPRKYQLYRLQAQQQKGDDTKNLEGSVTFAFGTAVGVGIQSVLEGKTEDQVLLDLFLSWDVDLLAANLKQKKSFWSAVYAVQKFISLRDNGLLADYELVYFNGKPAVELAFQINLPEDFKYRGFVDVVVQHKITKEVLIIELKTTSSYAQSAQYKNSGQALGYSVVLDILFPELSSYTVLYLVYETKSMEYKQLPFSKSLLQRALWLQELLIDTQIIQTYEAYSTYPMHGESCFDFFKECEYLSLCTLATKNLTSPLTQADLDRMNADESKYDFVIDFYDLVQTQIAKGEGE